MYTHSLIDLNECDLVLYKENGITEEDKFKIFDITYPLDTLTNDLYVIVYKNEYEDIYTILRLDLYLNLFNEYFKGENTLDDIIDTFGVFGVSYNKIINITEELDTFVEIKNNYIQSTKILEKFYNEEKDKERVNILLEKRIESFVNLINNNIDGVRRKLIGFVCKKVTSNYIMEILFDRVLPEDYIDSLKKSLFKSLVN